MPIDPPIIIKRFIPNIPKIKHHIPPFLTPLSFIILLEKIAPKIPINKNQTAEKISQKLRFPAKLINTGDNSESIKAPLPRYDKIPIIPTITDRQIDKIAPTRLRINPVIDFIIS